MIGQDINRAIELLNDGELVAIPTETVYGLAGNALNINAVSKIFSVKDRPTFDPLIVHVANWESIRKYVVSFPESAEKLARKFMPGPLTLLLPKSPVIPDLVTSGLSTVAIRIPDHPMTLNLLRKLSFPLAAPSANPFGYISPTTAVHVEEQLGDKIPYILDGGACKVGVESTIIGFDNDVPVVYRKGGTPVELLEKECGRVIVREDDQSYQPLVPGMLKSHYAPKTPLFLFENKLPEPGSASFAVLSFQRDYKAGHQEILSREGNLEEAARNLFAALRRLDSIGVDKVYAEKVPDVGLGRAINDRLWRASAR